MTLTTFDENLCRIIEPNVCATKRRFEVLKIMRDEGIPTVVWMTPILPFINDTEENIRGPLWSCIEAKVYGIILWGIGVTLRGNQEYFYKQLDLHFPGVKENISGIMEMRTRYHPRIRSDLWKLWEECEKHGISCNASGIFSYMSRFEDRHPENRCH